MKRNKKRLITALIIIVAVAAVLVFMKFFNGNLLYISTGMGKSVVMKVDGQKTYTFEAEVLMSDAKKQYEDMFGSSIWTEDIAGQPFEEYIKEQIRVKLIRVRCMNSMAKERGVVLGREEKNETANSILMVLQKNRRASMISQRIRLIRCLLNLQSLQSFTMM